MFTHIEDHPNHFVAHHKDGHQVHIAKAGLNKQTLNKLSKFSEGGKIEEKNSGPISPETAQNFSEGFNKATLYKDNNNSKLQEAHIKTANYAEGTPEGGVPAPQMEPTREPNNLANDIGQAIGKYGVSPVVNAVKDTANAYGTVAKWGGDIVNGVVKGVQGPAAERPQGNPDVQPAVDQVGAEQQPAGPQNVSLPTQGQPQQSVPFYDPSNVYKAALGQQTAGATKAAEVQGKIGQQSANQYEQQLSQMQQLHQETQKQRDYWQGEIKNLSADVAEGHIDPNKYLDNKGTFGKISTAIGLILGGIGGGLTNKENPAAKFLNEQINRDIEAQKANLGKKENLLGAMMRQYGNLNDAENAARLHMLAMVQGEVNKIAGQNAGQLAKANAQQLSGQLYGQMAPLIEQSAMRNAVFRSLQGQGGAVNHSAQAEAAIKFLVPEHQQQEAYKEMTALKNLKNGGENALKAFDQVANMAGNGLFSPRQKDALILPITAQLSKETAGKFTDSDAHMLSSLWPKVGDQSSTLQTKRQAMMRLINEKMNSSVLEGNGIPVPKILQGQRLSTTPNFKQSGMMPVSAKR